MTCLHPSACRRKLHCHSKKHLHCRACANFLFKSDPERHAKQSAAVKRAWTNPEYRAKKIAEAKARWQNPEGVAKWKATRKPMTDDMRRFDKKLRNGGVPLPERIKAREELRPQA